MEEFIGSPPLALGAIEERRQRLRDLSSRRAKFAVLADDVILSDHCTTSKDGNQVRLRWYSPKKKREATNECIHGSVDTRLPSSNAAPSPTPAVMYLHGGGLICSSIDDYDILVASLVSLTFVPFLAVDYRLAPEHKYPAALNDCYAGLTWLHANSQMLNVDSRRIAIMGSSAGAGLCAATAIHAKTGRHDEVKIAKQILIAPMVDYRNTRLTDPSLSPFMSWNHVDNAAGWSAYLGVELLTGKKQVPATASPSQLASAQDMPQLYLEVGGLDIFAEEGVEYALKHIQAGVPVELHVHPGLPHSYDSLGGQCERAQRAKALRLRAITSISPA